MSEHEQLEEIERKIKQSQSLLASGPASLIQSGKEDVFVDLAWAWEEKARITKTLEDHLAAKASFEVAIDVYKERGLRFLLAKALYYLGIVEDEISTIEQSKDRTKSISLLSQALNQIDKNSELLLWIKIKKRLGYEWYRHRSGDEYASLQKSIAELSDALTAAHLCDSEDANIIEHNLTIAEVRYAFLLRSTPPRCFISYAWEDTEHQAWVRHLAEDLARSAVHVVLDQWDESELSDIPKYMETSIRESDFVLLVCTPTFAIKADSGMGGVGYEKNIITGEIFTQASDRNKFVPLLRSGGVAVAIPSYLKGSLYYDFRDPSQYEESLNSLLRRIFGIPKYRRPQDRTDIWRDADEASEKKRYTIEYTDDPQFDPTIFEGPPRINDRQSVTLDARYRLQVFKHKAVESGINVVNVEIDRARSNWWADPGLLQRYKFDARKDRSAVSNRFSVSIRDLDSFSPELEQYYRAAAWHFQQGNHDPTGKRIKEPVLDVTMVNSSDTPVVISSIGICPLALWSIAKLIEKPKIIASFDVFFVRCDFEKLLCNICLTDPVFVAPRGPFRFAVSFVDYTADILRFMANESLIALVINSAQDPCYVSKPIYLGVSG